MIEPTELDEGNLDDFSPWRFTQERFILCEGVHDQVLLDCLIRDRHLPLFQIRVAKESSLKEAPGRSGFGPAIQGFGTIPGFDDLRGIMIVTDNDEERRLRTP